MKREGTSSAIKLSRFTGEIGSVQNKETNCFYIRLGLWLQSDLGSQDQVEAVKQLTKAIRYYGRAMSIDLHPSFLYSFVDVDLSEVFADGRTKQAFLAIESTVMLDSTLNQIKDNQELYLSSQGYLELLSDKIEEHTLFTYSKHRKKTKIASSVS